MAISATIFPRALVFLFIIAISIEGGRMRRLSYLGESDLVVDLPGQPSSKFRHYAGYVNINEDKSLFYWFFKAMKTPMRRPLVLWLNGGPGCSSVAAGALKEIGPFLVTNDGSSLRFNSYAWNQVANLLFLESPIGVGFSYSNKSSDLEKHNDQITAEDTYAFLINWFDKFPMFKSHEFYIAGESYAGHYVPQLAELIHERNKIMTRNSYINFKGVLIGNPALDWVADLIMYTEFAWNRGIISYNLYTTVINECKPPEDNSVDSWSQSCNDAINAVDESFRGIDWYHIYMPICSKSNTSKSEIGSGLVKEPIGYDPCATSKIEDYLKRDDVQRALHANVTGLLYPYSRCSVNISRTYSLYQVSTVVPIIRKLVDVGYRVWIYSGDVDGAVPFQATRQSIMSMNLTEKMWDKWGGWRRWYYEKQVAGWMVEYVEGLTFISVRGAGHMVPVFAPARSLTLFSHFLKGEPLPSNVTNRNT